MSISLVAGLGNPGREYELTRHNLGWIALDAYASRRGLTWRGDPQSGSLVARDERFGRPLWFVKPQTFMNDSGVAVGAFARYHRIETEEIAAVYDDIAIDLGLVKVTQGGGDAGHNGVASLIAHLGAGFIRFRLGVGPRSPVEMDLKDFILARFTQEQHTLIQQKTDAILHGLDLLLEKGPAAAMNELNRRDNP